MNSLNSFSSEASKRYLLTQLRKSESNDLISFIRDDQMVTEVT